MHARLVWQCDVAQKRQTCSNVAVLRLVIDNVSAYKESGHLHLSSHSRQIDLPTVSPLKKKEV